MSGKQNARRACLFVIALAIAYVTPRNTQAQVDARMLRYPDISATQITFVYGGDIWVVPKTGGIANRLSSPRGEETFPRFSPDGSKIAFSGNYDGNTDIYVIDANGGSPFRVTHHPAADRIVDWYPDGQSLLFASAITSEKDRFNKLFKVSAKGGLPEALPMPYAEWGAISPDGHTVAYTPFTNDFRTWKRYRGGFTSDIWLYDLVANKAQKISDPNADDTQPMWFGTTLYYLSDRGTNMRHNIWAYDTRTKQDKQITNYSDADVRFPSLGPNDMVFENGGRLYTLDLKTAGATPKEVPIKVVTDLASLNARTVRVGSVIGTRPSNVGISPTGKRAIVEVRGDVVTVPAENGMPIYIAQRSSSAERMPAWSPDGRTIAYWSDKTGEYELTVRNADGTGTERTVTKLGPGFRYHIYWSPDSRMVGFIDQAMKIWTVDVATGTAKQIDKANYYYEGQNEAFSMSWSPDSRFAAYARDLENQQVAAFVYDTKESKTHQVTSGFYSASAPAFDPEGKYLYVLTNRSLSPIYSDLDNSWVYANSTVIGAIPLRNDVKSPLAPRNDMEPIKDAAVDTVKPDSMKKITAKPTTSAVDIDFTNIERRLVVLPITPGNYSTLQAAPGRIFYQRNVRTGADDSKNPVVFFDVNDRKESTVIEDADNFALSADGKKLLLAKDGRLAIVDAAASQKMDKSLVTSNIELTITPRDEWKQIFNDAWRFERDMFYASNMHGVDWNAMRARYGALIDNAISREDLAFIIGELIAELNTSHTYRSGGDLEQPLGRSVGMLGADYALENGAYRIKHIVDGAEWDSEVRSPLSATGINVKEGDYLLAVNGRPVDISMDPWAAFGGLANSAVEITVNDRPTMQGARNVIVQTLSMFAPAGSPSEARLRNLQWIEAKRKRVQDATGGRVGYAYVPNTGIDGQTELVRMFQSQKYKDAFIIDERFNSGGQIPDRFVELLNRPLTSYYGVRDGMDWMWPQGTSNGPKTMLINEWSGSGGDAFPYYFKEAGLGPLIGKRTWGGLVGYTGAPLLVDSGSVTVPTFGIYSNRGEWVVENEGVKPDIEVEADPAQLAKGVDPQLETAIAEMLKELKEKPFIRPKKPALPIRSQPSGGGR